MMKPDYGLRITQQGVSRDVDLFFYDFVLFSLTILGKGQYSTMAERPYEGQWYAVSLDFDQEQLNAILANASHAVAASIRDALSADSASPRTIDLAEALRFPVRARLGTIQRTASETFVPLLCQEVLDSMENAPDS